MIISVINMTHGLLSNKEIITSIGAINRQLKEDFEPYWNRRAQLRLEGNSSETANSEPGSRNDFLGTRNEGQQLTSFGVNPGGYIGFYDPQKSIHDTFDDNGTSVVSGSNKAKRAKKPKYCKQRKNKARAARRGNRYQDFSLFSKVKEAELAKDQCHVINAGSHKI